LHAHARDGRDRGIRMDGHTLITLRGGGRVTSRVRGYARGRPTHERLETRETRKDGDTEVSVILGFTTLRSRMTATGLALSRRGSLAASRVSTIPKETSNAQDIVFLVHLREILLERRQPPPFW
jgi:hypothetical protein